ncbi:MAG: hypothetical protein NC908_03030 [Candidatus Omnitrophica bacterium]|nr:hypothetical protein [Candidatus Omnitrophota bacterium]
MESEMRDLVFKNLTSMDKRRRIIASSEVMERQGIRSIIRRHLVYIIKEISKDAPLKRPTPYLYILRERNTKEKRERFFCRIKGSIYIINNARLYLIVFAHSLNISLVGTSCPPSVISNS